MTSVQNAPITFMNEKRRVSEGIMLWLEKLSGMDLIFIGNTSIVKRSIMASTVDYSSNSLKYNTRVYRFVRCKIVSIINHLLHVGFLFTSAHAFSDDWGDTGISWYVQKCMEQRFGKWKISVHGICS